MDAPEPEQTPFAAVTAHTTKLQRVGLPSRLHFAELICANCGQQYQAILDQSTPYVTYRWIGTGVALLMFFLRIFFAQGWYIGK